MLQPKKPVKVMEKKIDVKVKPKPKPAPPKAKGMQRAFKYKFPLNVETESAQTGKSVKKTAPSKPVAKPAAKKLGNNALIPGMGLSPIFPKETESMSAKHGAKMNMKKAKSGLGMKSVKSGYDNNSGVTRADFVAIGKGKAKSGTKMKAGGKMAKCKYGCK